MSENSEKIQTIEEQYDILLQKHTVLLNKLAQLLDKYDVINKEFDEYKKRIERDKVQMENSAGIKMIKSLLPVFKDFDRAIIHLDKTNDVDQIKEGFTLIHKLMWNTLLNKGLEIVNPEPGIVFDSDIHEAVTTIPIANMNGKIIETVEVGYKFNEIIINYPKVVVGL